MSNDISLTPTLVEDSRLVWHDLRLSTRSLRRQHRYLQRRPLHPPRSHAGATGGALRSNYTYPLQKELLATAEAQGAEAAGFT